MAHALALGARGLGQVGAWPSVGCVLVRDGRVVGRGTSDPETLRHAEVVALDQAGGLARGATAFVTLEPCAHHGRTPPCANALVNAGVRRVVIATGDPNPLVAGKGAQILRDAGVVVETGLYEARAREQNKGFLSVFERGRPMVTLKLAMTLDGRIATASGESQWITGSEARRLVHAMRASHDAVLVGAGTAREDDPTLTVRDLGIAHQPVRIVATRRMNLPWPNKLADTTDKGPVWIMHGEGADAANDPKWGAAGVRLMETPITGGQLDLAGMLAILGKEGITRVFCEGGGALAASLLGSDLVDDLVVMSAGFALGAEGQPAIGALGLSALAEAKRFELVETRQLGADVLHKWVRT